LKISYITITVKDDFPFFGRPNLHVFEPTLESLKRQTLADIEWVNVDAQYARRKDYFKDLDLPFTVKHVPAQPNIWLEHKFPGISTQYNKGIIHADGELLFFADDTFMFNSDLFENLWVRYLRGYFPWAWYLHDWSCSTKDVLKTYGQGIGAIDLGLDYSFSGYTGKYVVPDQRHEYLKEKEVYFNPPWTWWCCCSSVSLEAMLKINGFDQRFDGDKSLMDVDVGSRLDMARYGIRAVLFRDLFLVRAASTYSLFKTTPSIKCNYGLVEHSRGSRRYKANCVPLSDYDIQWIKKVCCQKVCSRIDFCKKNHPWQYPFEHKAGYKGHWSEKKWFNFWKEHQELIDLENERKLRLSGEKYTEGTFVG